MRRKSKPRYLSEQERNKRNKWKRCQFALQLFLRSSVGILFQVAIFLGFVWMVVAMISLLASNVIHDFKW
jgi:hypothetical protein